MLDISIFIPEEHILNFCCYNCNPVLQLDISVNCSEFLTARKVTWNTNCVLKGYFKKVTRGMNFYGKEIRVDN